ncbi:MAG TPA: hypothetical protein G4O02_18075 [Caldilineae bacterium]|jgi:uncharacterized membrane protein YhdT|nr:hypothetical protein [Caldilineae bacterium]
MTKPLTENTTSGQAARSRWTWSLGGSLIASLCCAGPAMAVLLGIGGASFLLGLTRYRVPLLFIGLGFATLGLMRALRLSRLTCSSDQHRRNQWLFPLVTLTTFVVTYIVLAYVFPTAVYNSLKTPSGPSTDRSAQLETPSPVRTQALIDSQSAASTPTRTVQFEASAGTQPLASPTSAIRLRRATLAISGMT